MQIGGGQSLIEGCEDEKILLVMRAEKRMMTYLGGSGKKRKRYLAVDKLVLRVELKLLHRAAMPCIGYNSLPTSTRDKNGLSYGGASSLASKSIPPLTCNSPSIGYGTVHNPIDI
jgi:hypothetical protein